MGGGSQNTYVTIYILKTYVVFTCTEIDYSIILIIPLVIAKHLVLHIFKLLDNLYRYDSTIEKKTLPVPFRFNQFESREDCTCANNEFIYLARDKNPSVCTFYIL